MALRTWLGLKCDGFYFVHEVGQLVILLCYLAKYDGFKKLSDRFITSCKVWADWVVWHLSPASLMECSSCSNAWCFALSWQAVWQPSREFILNCTWHYVVSIDSGESEARTAAQAQLILLLVGKEAQLTQFMNSMACAHTTVVLPSSSLTIYLVVLVWLLEVMTDGILKPSKISSLSLQYVGTYNVKCLQLQVFSFLYHQSGFAQCFVCHVKLHQSWENLRSVVTE